MLELLRKKKKTGLYQSKLGRIYIIKDVFAS